MKIRKGDQVVVLAGKDRGKRGEVVHAYPKEGKVVVKGVNVVQRHRKPRSATDPGGIIPLEKPIDASNVAIIDPDGAPTRIGYRIEADGTKTRISRRTGAEL
ncbi:MAG: 50S ribosomal protein L24 [Microthrixaceae bacterium]